MKRILSCALAIALFASCAKSDVTAVYKSNQMSFSAYSNESLAGATRGVDVDNTTITTSGESIGVYAYGKTGIVVNSTLNNLKLDYSSSTGYWEGDETAYWAANTDYSFYAYYPYVTSFASTATQIITDYTQVPFSAASQTDILYSAATNISTGADVSSMPAVTLTLKHATSKVDFQISVVDNCTLTINSLRIEGISTAHTGLALADGFNSTVTENYSHGDSRYYYYGSTQNFDSAIAVTSAAATKLSESTSKGAFYLLPQSITPWSVDAGDTVGSSQGARVVINYTLTKDGAIIIPESGSGTQNAAFPIPVIKDQTTGEVIGLQDGKSYLFTMEFGENKAGGWEPESPFEPVNPQEDESSEIKFIVSVNPWVSYVLEIPLN